MALNARIAFLQSKHNGYCFSSHTMHTYNLRDSPVSPGIFMPSSRGILTVYSRPYELNIPPTRFLLCLFHTRPKTTLYPSMVRCGNTTKVLYHLYRFFLGLTVYFI